MGQWICFVVDYRLMGSTRVSSKIARVDSSTRKVCDLSHAVTPCFLPLLHLSVLSLDMGIGRYKAPNTTLN
jgi:hypothetical protein